MTEAVSKHIAFYLKGTHACAHECEHARTHTHTFSPLVYFLNATATAEPY